VQIIYKIIEDFRVKMGKMGEGKGKFGWKMGK